ncbi:MAG: MATE family efflux transporter [Firmicutes bacterium]|nr:MATE family efflux transporter [Bacillota bacterium]
MDNEKYRLDDINIDKLNDEERKIVDKRIKNRVLTNATPVFIELVVGSLFGMVDMMMLGNIKGDMVGAASLSSVGITNQLVFLGLSLVQALCIGGTTMIARYLGAHEEDRMGDVVKHVIIMAVLFVGIPVVLLSQLLTVPVMKFVGATPEVLQYGQNYFKIICSGFIFQCINVSLFSALRGVQNTKAPMFINLIANAINVIGNYILIYGKLGVPALGATGAAISTITSQALASIMVIIYFIKFEDRLNVNFKKKFKFNPTTMSNLVKIGVPASLEQLALRGGLFLFIRLVTSLGTLTHAAHQICINILSLSFTTGQSLGISTSALVGHALGEKRPDRAKEYMMITKKIGFTISLFIGMLLFFFGKYAVALYTNEAAIIEMSGDVLKIIALVQPFQTVQLLTAGGLRGAGDTVFPLIATTIGTLFIRTIVGYSFVYFFNMGLVGAWIGVVVDQLTRFFVIEKRSRGDEWLKVKIK